ncbi:MAG TPA: TonB-dependent receptor [Candidatus Baltobacteraceae bacterium]|nr:TonB-dependent receptor [Candidatus Baltobacteraceae bacterium]
MGFHFGRAPTARAIGLTFILAAQWLLCGPAIADREHHDVVSGSVNALEGKPVVGARVTLRGHDRGFSATSDRHGRFEIHDVPRGTYDIFASAPGYASLSQHAVAVGSRGTMLSLVLSPASPGSLTVIGEVTSSAGASVSTSSVPSVALDAQTAAAAGTPSVAQVLWSQLGVTPVLPIGGGSNAPQEFALRGPDPTETLVDIDGHPANNGNTGDFDLGLIDPAALQDVQIVYGISPSSLLGPNTLGGAINLVTLQPTQAPHWLMRGFTGSFGSTGQTLQTTGSEERFGYAVSLHRATSLGSVNQSVPTGTDGQTQAVGSSSFGETALTKLRYRFSGYGYVQASFRDQAVNQDLSSLLTTAGDSFAGTSQASHQANYGLDAFVPLGAAVAGNIPATTATFSHLTSLASQSVAGPGAQTSPYLYDQRDLLGDDWLQIDHRFGNGDLSFKYDVSTEALTTNYVPGGAHADIVTAGAASPRATATPTASITPSQTQRWAVLRYQGNPNSHVHYAVAAYASDFSTFGGSLDPRAGFVWNPTAATAFRASVGTTFQAPQLSELYVPPTPPRPVGGIVYTGNPNLRPDYATEYDLGLEQILGTQGDQTRLSLDFYRSNVRAPAALLVVTPHPGCKPSKCPTSYPVNAGAGVYTGIDASAQRALGHGFRVRAGWDVDSSYLTSIPASIQDGTLVVGEQTLGQPLHKAYVGFDRDAERGWNYGATLNYEGAYNELNRSPFATLDAHLLYRIGRFDVGLYGTNLTNVYSDPFTLVGGGVPYGSLPGTPTIATDAYALQGTKLVLVVTVRQ